MKKIILAGILAAVSISASADQFVNGYTRSDGSYVQPHVRSSPNGSSYDNYSTKGNSNPYTGQQGTVDPYKSTYSNPYETGQHKSKSGW